MKDSRGGLFSPLTLIISCYLAKTANTMNIKMIKANTVARKEGAFLVMILPKKQIILQEH